jgi:integrase
VTENIAGGTVVPRATEPPPEPPGPPEPPRAPAAPGADTRYGSAVYGAADFALPAEAAALIEEAVPENTALAYGSRWRSFETWCQGAGRVALPATAQTVAAYLTYLAVGRGLKATTVDAHLTAIRTVHRASGEEPPDALAARKIVVAAQKREARRDGRYGPGKALPLMAADLPLAVAACDAATPAGLRDRAVVLLGFALLARRSELAALNISDIGHVRGEGLEVMIRSSKTDQSARGVVRRIHYAANKDVCPVRSVLAWLEYLAGRGITAGPLFTRIDRWGNADGRAGGRYRSAGARDGRLRPQGIGDIITVACEAAAGNASAQARGAIAGGVSAETPVRRYSGHSVRRGGATSMLRAGADPLNVSRHGRWADGSRVFAGYVEEATGFGDGNPTKGLLLSTF